MKVTLILGICLIVILHQVSGNLKNKWRSYKVLHRRKFNVTEETRRFNLFQRNLKKIDFHNQRYMKGEVTFKVKENRFTDMNVTRVRTLMNGFKLTRRRNKIKPQRKFIGFSSETEQPLPKAVDWRERKVVTRPQDQGKCASCWSFSAIGSIEAQRAIQSGQLTPLSAQYLVDCSNAFGNAGCKGGQHDNAFEFIINNGGIIPEARYPYTGLENQCPKVKSEVDTIVDYWQVPTGDELALMKAVAFNGPTASAIDASRWSMHHYAGGIYFDQGCSNTSVDHSVLVVGYGSENGKDFWILRNSWGEDWGESGYVRLIRNKNNHCGIATMASYPIV